MADKEKEKVQKQKDFAERFESEDYIGTLDDLYSSRTADDLTTVGADYKYDIQETHNNTPLLKTKKMPGMILRCDERNAKQAEQDSFDLSYIKELKPDTSVLNYKIRVPSIDSILPIPKVIGSEMSLKDKKIIDLYKDYSPESFNEKFNAGDYVDVSFENNHSFKNGKIVTSYAPRYQATAPVESDYGLEKNSSSLNFDTPNATSEEEVKNQIRAFKTRDPNKGNPHKSGNPSDARYGVFSQKFFDYVPSNAVKGIMTGWCFNLGFDELYTLCKELIIKRRAAEKRVSPLIIKYSQKYGYDHRFIRAIISMESGYNPEARNPETDATGLSQFMLDTYRSYSKTSDLAPIISAKGGGDLRKDPEVSIVSFFILYREIVAYIKRKFNNPDYTNDMSLTACGHNAGPGGPERALRKAIQAGHPNQAYRYLPRETKNFISTVNMYNAIYCKEIYPNISSS